MFTKAHFKNITAFDDLKMTFSQGINIFIGENGTGKTHIMKALYAACDIIENNQTTFPQKLNDVFYPSNKLIGRIVKRSNVSSRGRLQICRRAGAKDVSITLTLTSHTVKAEKAKTQGIDEWCQGKVSCAFIPVKDMLANAPGFSALYHNRDIHFEEIYSDILLKAELPQLKGKKSDAHQRLLTKLSDSITGTVIEEGGEFFLKNDQGNLEFTLLAEGFRKLGLLWRLIQNGTLLSGSVLFWDEPETNLNPSIIPMVVDILLELQRQGTQIFIATHDYLLAKYFEIKAQSTDALQYLSLYHNSNAQIECEICPNFRDLKNNRNHSRS